MVISWPEQAHRKVVMTFAVVFESLHHLRGGSMGIPEYLLHRTRTHDHLPITSAFLPAQEPLRFAPRGTAAALSPTPSSCRRRSAPPASACWSPTQNFRITFSHLLFAFAIRNHSISQECVQICLVLGTFCVHFVLPISDSANNYQQEWGHRLQNKTMPKTFPSLRPTAASWL